MLGTLARVIAGMTFGHYQYLDWISLQAVPYTATDVFLEAWAALKGVNRKPAASAIGTATFTGTNATDIPQGTTLNLTANISYYTNEDVQISSGTASAGITATSTGSASNAPASSTLTIASPINGLNATATSSVITGGTEIETDDSLRTRMLLAFSAPAQGGSSTDYVEWATDVPGCTRAWCLPNGMGVGTVIVYSMFDIAEATFQGFPQGNPGGATLESRTTPATGDLLSIANFIFPLRPVTALVWSIAPQPQSVNITIDNLSPNTSAIHTAISAAISDLFVRIGDPTGPLGPSGGMIYQSDFTSAIESVPGLVRYKLAITTPVTIAQGYLPVLGTTSFSS